MNEFIVIEVGSTNLKQSHQRDGVLTELPDVSIAFKTNLQKLGHLDDSDLNELYNIVNKAKNIAPLHIFGTSVFRNLTPEQKDAFLTEFESKTGIEFNIVSPEQESEYTVRGCVLGNNFNGRVAVMIGGGGSTEVCIVENKQIIEKHYNNYGVSDVMNAFPMINDKNPKIDTSTIDEFCENKTQNIENKTNVLILAGGDYLRFYDATGSDLIQKNKVIDDKLMPNMISKRNADKIDERFVMTEDLEDYIKRQPEFKSWWHGTRGMRFCVRAVVKKCGADIIIPTRINMLAGIIEELKA